MTESLWWLFLHIPGCLWICIPGSLPGRWTYGCSSPLQLSSNFSSLYCICVGLSSPHPSPALGPHLGTRLMGKLTPYFFPQVPPGAAETPKAPGTSELHGGHLQGTRILWERRGRLGPRAEKSGPGIGKEAWPGPGTHRHSIKVCGWMNE